MIKHLPGSHHLVTPTAADLESLPWVKLVQWCHATARYGLVTQELVEWLQGVIGGRRAIEVASGQGDLGFALGIPMSDLAIQQRFYMQSHYGNEVRTNPPPDVERIHAMQALAKYKPQVVIASWLTQKYEKGDRNKKGEVVINSLPGGVDECKLISQVETYIHIGNIVVHPDKRAFKIPHQEYKFPWLWSRANAPELNRIWVWDNQRQK